MADNTAGGDDGSNNTTINNDGGGGVNWLGFSLSPHMNMENAAAAATSANNPATSHPISTAASFFLHHHHPHHYNSSGLYFSPLGETATTVFQSPNHHHQQQQQQQPLTVMPIKSDGSLCIMEALSRSQQPQGGMVSTSPPKLENFLGVGEGATHHHHQQPVQPFTTTTPLSLDTIYYHNQYNHHHHRNAPTHEHENQHDTVTAAAAAAASTHFHPIVTYFSSPMFHPQTSIVEQQQRNTSNHSNNDDEDATPTTDHFTTHFTNNWIQRYSSQPVEHHQSMEISDANLIENGGGGGGGGGGSSSLQSLSLSMSPGSQSSTGNTQISIPPGSNSNVDCCMGMENTGGKKRSSAGKMGGATVAAGGSKQPVHRKSIDTFGQRTSQYRGVTKHRWTGRYEAHLWDNSCKKEGQTRKGRQVYLGGYDMEEKAARAYDLAALKYWGPSTHINFPLENYKQEVDDMKNMSRQEFVAHLRRKSSGFSRGASMYRGVTRHHQHGRWQARIGRVAGNKDLYLGTFSTQEEAAEAYDIAAIKFRGVNAVTNFDITRYDVEKIMNSNTLLAGEQAKRIRALELPSIEDNNNSIIIHTTTTSNHDENNTSDWKMVDHEMINRGSSSPCFSVALQDLIGMDSSTNQQQQVMVVDHHESNNKMVQFSNTSSIVTSLNSSREASPADNRSSPNSNINHINVLHHPKQQPTPIAWISSPQLRPPPISVSHFPAFAAWSDA